MLSVAILAQAAFGLKRFLVIEGLAGPCVHSIECLNGHEQLDIELCWLNSLYLPLVASHGAL